MVKKVFLTLVVILLCVNISYSQKVEKFKTDNIYVLKSLNEIKQLGVKAEVYFRSSDVVVRTFGEAGSLLYDKSCHFKGKIEKEEKDGVVRLTVDCLTGGKLIIAERTGQKKFAFVNIMKNDSDFFSSGIVYTNFSTDSPKELLMW